MFACTAMSMSMHIYIIYMYVYIYIYVYTYLYITYITYTHIQIHTNANKHPRTRIHRYTPKTAKFKLTLQPAQSKVCLALHIQTHKIRGESPQRDTTTEQSGSQSACRMQEAGLRRVCLSPSRRCWLLDSRLDITVGDHDGTRVTPHVLTRSEPFWTCQPVVWCMMYG
jgi:hypothetical protein